MNTEEHSMDSFDGWDSNISEVDFFSSRGVFEEGQKATGKPRRPAFIKEDADSLEKNPKEDVKEEEPEEEIRMFETPDEDLVQEAEEAEGGKGVGSTMGFIRRMRDRKLFSISDEDMPKTEREARERLDDYLEQSVENSVVEKLSSLPEVAQNLIKYTMNGGDPHAFMRDIVNNRPKVLSQNMDLADAQNQELIIRTQLYADGYDDDYVDTQIEFLRNNNRMHSTAQAHYKRWLKMEEARHQQIAKQQREAVQQEKERRRKLRNEVHEMVAARESIGGVKLSQKDRKQLPEYMTDRSVQLKNGQIVTEMQRDLMEILSNDEKAILLAKLLKSGFDLKEVEMDVTTRVTDSIRQDMRRTKNFGVPTGSGSAGIQKRTLADIFSD